MWTEAWRRQSWIISRRADLLLFIGTPLLCLALIVPLSRVVPSDRLALVLLALFATGHHLPTFMRVFGDPKLFARYPGRFLLAPPLTFAVALWFAAHDLHGLILVTVLWDLWHSFMQHYGFMRIYAAKGGDLSPTLSWLDLWVSLCWFIGIALWSPVYSLSLLRPIVQTTGCAIPHEVLQALRWLAAAATALITAVYLAATIRAMRAGQPVSPAKLLLLATTIAVIACAWWMLNDLVIGYAIWAVFHDVQYFAIVWVSHRGLLQKGDAPRPFLAFLFRQHLPMIALYVAILFAYGSLSLVQDGLEPGMVRTLLGAYIATSTLMHYYFDGFIWKVRESTTREALGVSPVTTAGKTLPDRPHGERLAIHFAALVVPVVIMLLLEPTSRSSVHTYRALTSIYPGWGEVKFRLADELATAGKLAEAADAYHAGLRQQPDAPLAHENLATIYRQLHRLDYARYHLRCAARLTPRDPDLKRQLRELDRVTESSACCEEAVHR
ncbi:MAG: tetratricopeptide repeat protein [Planctomycetota bacterium]